jgi:hypothetical protein
MKGDEAYLSSGVNSSVLVFLSDAEAYRDSNGLRSFDLARDDIV